MADGVVSTVAVCLNYKFYELFRVMSLISDTNRCNLLELHILKTVLKCIVLLETDHCNVIYSEIIKNVNSTAADKRQKNLFSVNNKLALIVINFKIVLKK